MDAIAEREKRHFAACLCGHGRYSVRYRVSYNGQDFEILRCDHCGLVRTLPPPDDLCQLQLGDRVHSEGEIEGRLSREKDWISFADHLLDLLEARCPRRGGLLDVGCHISLLVEQACKRGWDAAGVDINPYFVEYGKLGRGLDLRFGRLEEVAFDDESFDAVVMSQLLEHVPQPVHLLAEAHRVLTPKGVLLVESPNIDGIPARYLKERWYGLCPHEHYWHFVPSTLLNLLQQAGFEDVDVAARYNLHYQFSPTPRGIAKKFIWKMAEVLNCADQVTTLAVKSARNGKA